MATLTGARLVEELAAEIDAAGGRSPRVRAAVEKARAAALELGNERTLGYVPVLKKALGAAVEGLEAIAPAVHAPGLPALAATARKAVAAIDPDRPFALQRGPVQDAVRAIADAVLVARTAVSSARRFVAGQRLSAQ
jgi:hypothetical protein